MSMTAPDRPMTPQTEPATRPLPLVVDLETLASVDLMTEAAIALLRRPDALRDVVAGREGSFRARVAGHARVDPATLPYSPGLLALLRERRGAGQPLVLVTTYPGETAARVAEHLGLFDEILAPGDTPAGRFGENGFDLVGGVANPRTSSSARSIVAAPRDDRPGVAAAFASALRPQQWLKNLLVFIPLLTAPAARDPGHLLLAVLAFVAFGLAASAIYVINDLLDLPEDRLHPRKRLRAFAAGHLPVLYGVTAAPLLLLAAVAIAAYVSTQFLLVILTYILATTAYSLSLKRIVLVDVFTLAGLYTLRLIGGSIALGQWPSLWLLGFSTFIFLSLAMLKRFTELRTWRELGVRESPGRGYTTSDLEYLAHLGGSAGYVSVLVLALYTNSATIQPSYAHPDALWLLCPLLLYWISRIWLIAHRGMVHDDPIVFAVRDRVSLGVAALMAAVVFVAL